MNRGRGPGMRRASGFTLIEVIVAFALLAGALTLLVGTLSNASQQIRNADDVGRATLHAQSLLAGLGAGEPLRTGASDGEFDAGRYRWTLQVTPYADPASNPDAMPGSDAFRLLQVDLQVEWGTSAGQRLHWRSLRLAPRSEG